MTRRSAPKPESGFVWVADVGSRHFDFTAYGATRAEALRAFKDGIAAHGGDPDWAESMISDAEHSVRKVRLGACYRDDFDLLQPDQ